MEGIALERQVHHSHSNHGYPSGLGHPKNAEGGPDSGEGGPYTTPWGGRCYGMTPEPAAGNSAQMTPVWLLLCLLSSEQARQGTGQRGHSLHPAK